MLKKGNSPYWKRSQYQTLIAAKWDIIIIMLGTNDAKHPASHGPDNWRHDCTIPGNPLTANLTCSFAQDFKSMIDVVRTLGTTPEGPVIYSAIPPPLYHQGAYGMNQSVINEVFPVLISAINKANNLPHPVIDIFDAVGGKVIQDIPA